MFHFYFYKFLDIGFLDYFMQLGITIIGVFIAFLLSLKLYRKQNQRKKIEEEKKKELAKKEQKRKKKKRELDLLKYYNELIKSIIEISNDQFKYIDNFSKSQNDSISVLGKIDGVTTNDFNRVLSLNIKELFEAWSCSFQSNDSLNMLRDLNAEIDFLDKSIHDIEEIYKYRANRYYDKFIHAKSIIDEIPVKIYYLLSDSELSKKISNKLESFINTYNNLCENYESLEQLKDDFIEPLSEYITDLEISNNSLKMIDLSCRKAFWRIDEIIHNNTSLIDELNKIKTSSSSSINYIKKISSRIDSLIEVETSNKIIRNFAFEYKPPEDDNR